MVKAIQALAPVPDISQKRIKKIPDYLVYEVMDGKPYYRKGYKSVLRKLKSPEEIMGVSKLQASIISHIVRIIFRFLSEDDYYVHFNESGLHLDKNDNMAGDIHIFDKTVLTPDQIDEHYADVPPLVNIEVDIKVDLAQESDFDYIHKKTQKLHAFGTEKVIWILKPSQTVIVAERNKNWEIISWDNDIEIMQGITFNLTAYLKKEGISLDKHNP